MIRLDKLTNYVFYIGVVLAILSLSNITIIVHSDFIKTIPVVLGLILYILHGYVRVLPRGALFSLMLFIIYAVFIRIFRNFEIDWAFMSFILYIPLISSRDMYFLKNVLYIKIITILFVFGTAALGIAQDVTFVKLDGISHSLGFFHPNTLGTIFLSVFFDFIIVFKHLKRNYLAIIFPFLLYFAYTITYSRTSTIIIAAALCVYFLRHKLRIIKMKKTIFLGAMLLIFSIGIFYSYFYDSSNVFYRELDEFLTNRVHLGYDYIQRYGFTLFPKYTPNIVPLGWWSDHQVFNDNTYLKFALSQGLVLTGLLLFYILKNILSYRYSSYNALLIMLIFIFLIIEALGFNVFLFSPLLFNFMLLSSDESDKPVVL